MTPDVYPDALYEKAVQLAEFRALTEYNLIATVYADPARGLPVAQAEGITRDHFQQDDLRILWCAAELMQDYNLAALYQICRRALMSAHFWDETQIAGNVGTSMLWSDESLTAMFGEWIHSEHHVRSFSRELVKVEARQWQAQDAYERCLGLLGGEIEPDLAAHASAVPPKQRVVVMPVRKHVRRGRAA